MQNKITGTNSRRKILLSLRITLICAERCTEIKNLESISGCGAKIRVRYVLRSRLCTMCAGRIEPNSTKGPLTWQERLRIAKGAAQGIAYIHECSPRKHVHGDIKPSNILLDAFLEARIADFGLQRLLSLAGPEPFKQVDSRFRGDHTGRASSVSPSPAYAPGMSSSAQFHMEICIWALLCPWKHLQFWKPNSFFRFFF